MNFDQLSNKIIGCAIEVHKVLGPGLLESTYEQCLAHEFKLNKIPYKLQCPVPVEYKGIQLESGFRADVIVDQQIILELKSVSEIADIHKAQLLTYMKLSKIKTGFIFNFNVQLLRDGLSRFVL